LPIPVSAGLPHLIAFRVTTNLLLELVPPVTPPTRLGYVCEPNAISNAIRYGKFYSRSHDAVIHSTTDLLPKKWQANGNPLFLNVAGIGVSDCNQERARGDSNLKPSDP
jgi:hypothetical protein